MDSAAPDLPRNGGEGTTVTHEFRDAQYGRVLLGHAQGIVRERFGMTPDEACDYLARVSSLDSRRLRAVMAA